MIGVSVIGVVDNISDRFNQAKARYYREQLSPGSWYGICPSLREIYRSYSKNWFLAFTLSLSFFPSASPLYEIGDLLRRRLRLAKIQGKVFAKFPIFETTSV
jgi:hypothetical protein